MTNNNLDKLYSTRVNEKEGSHISVRPKYIVNNENFNHATLIKHFVTYLCTSSILTLKHLGQTTNILFIL